MLTERRLVKSEDAADGKVVGEEAACVGTHPLVKRNMIGET